MRSPDRIGSIRHDLPFVERRARLVETAVNKGAPFLGRHVVVGVTGGIAAYKAAELVRLLVREAAEVRVAMTENATRFVAPLTFEALSGHRVIRSMWEADGTGIDHIAWGQETDLILVAPATANIIGKAACGIADDFLSTMLLAATARTLLCPSMNTRMFENPVLQENLSRLLKRGFSALMPGVGALACRTEGRGRLPEPEDILEEARRLLTPQDLEGRKILVTAGATREPIDPVRYVSNRSSGKMGYALARAARQRGATVVLVSGSTALKPPVGVEVVGIGTALDMRQSVFSRLEGCDMVIKAAAVSDYRPKTAAPQKVKKGAEELNLDMVKNPDILKELGMSKGDDGPLLVGFAAETEALLEHAREKLRSKNLDMIVANDVSAADAGFQTDTNRVKMLFRDGRVEESGLLSKDAVAHLVLDRAMEILTRRPGEARRD